ncbi:MAG TPA: zinc-binding alcohol dehydrogenase, partial [Polyangiales bacterium]|nr:zinc-binding alcohol dehydrogenase [Polyangiales bacterium]
ESRATLIPQVETALTALWDAQLVFRQRVVVLGGGLIGLLIARFAQQAGAEDVQLIEAQPSRRELAQRFGIQQVCAPEQVVPSGDADIVFEVSGQPQQLDVAIEHCGMEATVVVVSFYGARTSALQLGSTFHRRRLQLKSSQVSHLPPVLTPRWSHPRRLHSVLQLLNDPSFDALLGVAHPFGSAPDVYAQLDASSTAELCTLFRYDDLDADAAPT